MNDRFIEKTLSKKSSTAIKPFRHVSFSQRVEIRGRKRVKFFHIFDSMTNSYCTIVSQEKAEHHFQRTVIFIRKQTKTKNKKKKRNFPVKENSLPFRQNCRWGFCWTKLVGIGNDNRRSNTISSSFTIFHRFFIFTG